MGQSGGKVGILDVEGGFGNWFGHMSLRKVQRKRKECGVYRNATLAG